MFWGSIGNILVECFNESFAISEMSSSQRQAVITLIEKKDQDRCDLKNWRPISLLNVDAKIALKVIAERMKRLLPELIHDNQSGYIPGRWIGENIRSILEIMQYTQSKELPGLLLFIDFEKALSLYIIMYQFWQQSFHSLSDNFRRYFSKGTCKQCM